MMNFDANERLAEAQRQQGLDYLDLAVITAISPEWEHEWHRTADGAFVVIENPDGGTLKLKFLQTDLEECNEDADPDFKKVMRESVISAINKVGALPEGQVEVDIVSPPSQGFE